MRADNKKNTKKINNLTTTNDDAVIVNRVYICFVNALGFRRVWFAQHSGIVRGLLLLLLLSNR